MTGATDAPRRAVLVTGMSGAGKSTVLAELARRGHAVLDTDDDARYLRTAPPGPDEPDGPGERLWDEERVHALLDAHARDRHGPALLVVQGTVANQGRLYPRFAAVVLLTAPLDVLLARVATRTTNPFGKDPAERARIVADHADVEPLLRAGATHVVDTRAPVTVVADQVEAAARPGPPAPAPH